MNVDYIKSIKLRSYFSFFQGVKAENIRNIYRFYNAEKMKENKSIGGLCLIIVPKSRR